MQSCLKNAIEAKLACHTCVLVGWCVFQAQAISVPIQDLADISGIRENHLVGYGLVVGLADTAKN